MENDVFLPGFNAEAISVFPKRDYSDSPFNSGIHFHDFTEILINVSGVYEALVENTVYSCRPGTAVLIKPYDTHNVRIPPKTECVYYVVWIYNGNSDLFSRLFGSDRLITLDEKDEKRLISFCERTTTGGYAEDEKFEMLSDYFYMLTCFKNAAPVESRPFPAFFRSILDYVDVNFREIKYLKEVSDHFGISRHYLIKLFKEHINILPKDYVELKRMSAAKTDMLSGMNITEACLNNGFCDYCYFIKRFKYRFGVTPKKWQTAQLVNK